MQTYPKKPVNDYSFTQNRELSCLSFNRRVLEKAEDAYVPAFERLKFISIFAGNLDEFFMVRVGRLESLAMENPEFRENKTGLTPSEQLEKVYDEVSDLMHKKAEIYGKVMAKLRNFGIFDLENDELTEAERSYIEGCFAKCAAPLLSPCVLEENSELPFFENGSLYIAAILKDCVGAEKLGILPLPNMLHRCVFMPDGFGRFCRMENLLMWNIKRIFRGFEVENAVTFRVTRSADMTMEISEREKGKDICAALSRLLKVRAAQPVVRLELFCEINDDFTGFLERKLKISRRKMFFDAAALDMAYVSQLRETLNLKHDGNLFFTPYVPKRDEKLKNFGSIIDCVRKKDMLLFFPFDGMTPFLRLLNEAALRADVTSISITVYRLAPLSEVVKALCRAAENGKKVTVLVELRARFSESDNISWTKVLERAGCRVIHGAEGYKCHGKICLITMKDGEKTDYITQIGTGNYNEKTSRIYTDLSYITARRTIGADGAIFFENMLKNDVLGKYSHLLLSPKGIKLAVLNLIEREKAKGKEGYICIKANALSDRDIIDKLSEASCAGVRVQLIIRGICCILPEIHGKTENITIKSIVGRFLEHARVYCFGKGETAEIYISSADMMERNLERRVEIACPIYDGDIKRRIMEIIKIQLRDGEKGVQPPHKGLYAECENEAAAESSQDFFINNWEKTI